MAISTVKAVLNGTTHTLSLNQSTGNYEATVSAPSVTSYNNNSGHYYPITVVATDSAGNSTTVTDSDSVFGNILKLRVKETVAPAIVITAPTEGQYLTNSKPTITWNVTDSGSGVDSSSISITIDDGSALTGGITKTAITNGYSCSYAISTALSEGSHTVKINAKDNDGNSATQRTVNFTVDITPPVLSVTSPVNNLITNNTSITVSGTTSDVTTDITSVTIKLNNGAEISVDVSSSGAFSKSLTLAEGANTITVVATNAAGLSSTVIRTVTIDTQAPTISNISIAPNPVSTGELVSIAVTAVDS